jgi:hypothetical protein
MTQIDADTLKNDLLYVTPSRTRPTTMRKRHGRR